MSKYQDYLKSKLWKRKAEAAKKRAGHRCQVCNAGGRLEAHHRTYERVGKEKPGDLVALCPDCHHIFHKGEHVERNRRAAEKAPSLDEIL